MGTQVCKIMGKRNATPAFQPRTFDHHGPPAQPINLPEQARFVWRRRKHGARRGQAALPEQDFGLVANEMRIVQRNRPFGKQKLFEQGRSPVCRCAIEHPPGGRWSQWGGCGLPGADHRQGDCAGGASRFEQAVQMIQIWPGDEDKLHAVAR
jgi:hypothetical protein